MNRIVGAVSEQGNESLLRRSFKWLKSLLSFGNYNHSTHQPTAHADGSAVTQNHNPQEDDDTVYNAERLLWKRVVHGRTEFLVKWEGLESKHNTWEPEANIIAPELLAQFKKLEERRMKGRVALGRRKRAAQPALESSQGTDPSGSKKMRTTPQERQADMVFQNHGYLAEPVGDSRDPPKQPTGFHRGLQAQEVQHVERINGELMLLVKWEGSDIREYVAAREVNQKCPQLVINYYQPRLVCGNWYD